MNMPIILYINTKLVQTNQKRVIFSRKKTVLITFFQYSLRFFATETIFAYLGHIRPDKCKVRAIFRLETFAKAVRYHG